MGPRDRTRSATSPWTGRSGTAGSATRCAVSSRATAGSFADLGFRLTGSADLYADDGRSAYNSVNFVTCHDGFTLRDLVSYNGKHNEANLEENRDGTDDNNSWNCGAEGETDDPEIVRLRRRLAKNHACLSALLLRGPR